MTETRLTSAIKIGDARYRKLLGDIDGLAASIHDIRPDVMVFDVAQYWAGLRAVVKAGPKHIPTAKLRTELRRLHELFGPAANRETS